MLWLVVVILVILWALGFFSGVAVNVGPLLHLLLVIALVVLIYQLVTGRRVPPP